MHSNLTEENQAADRLKSETILHSSSTQNTQYFQIHKCVWMDELKQFLVDQFAVIFIFLCEIK